VQIKSELRNEFKKKRSSLKNKEETSLEICNIFLNSDTYKNVDIILCYSSVNDEVNTDLIIRKSLNDGKITALPRCINSNGLMKYFVINSVGDVKKGMFGISEPDINCRELIDFNNSVCIVPALSFDKNGYRLGYGKGFYDRFLENYSFISVGLCYNDLIVSNLPKNKFDRKVDAVISENGIFFCKGE